MNQEKLGSSYASLDLGGGSTQITFVPSDPANIPGIEGRKQFKHSVRVLGNQQQVHSSQLSNEWNSSYVVYGLEYRFLLNVKDQFQIL